VLTVTTVAMSAAALYFFGGPSLEGFAFVVLVGAIAGTFSTVYVAAALDVDWAAWADRRRTTHVKAGAQAGHRVPRR
jgi:preprotein translocase subunit SecF